MHREQSNPSRWSVSPATANSSNSVDPPVESTATATSWTPSPSTSGAENVRHSSTHPIGPNGVSDTPSPSASTAITLKAPCGSGHPPVSPAFVATKAFPLTPGVKTPDTLVTLQTGNPSPMSSAPSGSGLSVGEGEGMTYALSGSGCHAGVLPFVTTAVTSPVSRWTKRTVLLPSSAVSKTTKRPSGEREGPCRASEVFAGPS